ncbi:MAG: DUF1800 domain-containing protein, partial [Gammaproteobacteria bacterium]|nr:DUF1800 domain-containing protein [Gammaproteobacteria bacterium]
MNNNYSKRRRIGAGTAIATLFLILAGCGGSSSPGTPSPPPPPPQPPPPPPPTMAEAFKFLNQTTFGATEAEADLVLDIGYEAWIDAQMQEPASLQLPYLLSLPDPQFQFQLNGDRLHIWADNVINGPDQLRQRVAFALSEIMVVSQLGALRNAPYSLASYYDLLAENAFGNYRDLMEQVTLHPAMGVYLSMLGNEKPNPALNIRPDENFARELMQLFTIGLVELELDGSVKTGIDGQPIPTYTQEIIEGFAHVYTGWHYAGAPSFQQARRTKFNQVIPMQLYPNFHDTGPKQLLNGVVLPAGQSGDQDLADALDNIFNHPNVGPFVAKRLIERLVTSNPSPEYVARIASAFNNNGSGVRGDLATVVKRILLDPEARRRFTPRQTDGKIKEPLLRLTQLWRAYDARSDEGRYPLGAAYIFFGQGPLQSPSVFNFFSPFYAPPGEIR